MEERRIVLLLAKRQSGWTTSTGYVVGPGLVLTAKHGVAGADEVEVRPVSPSGEDAGAEIVWLSPDAPGARPEEDLDAALLRVSTADAPWADLPPVRWGVYSQHETADVRCAGFPRQVVADGLREIADASGSLTPFGGLRQGLHELLPTGEPTTADGWMGLSGAVVTCEGRVLGVVRTVPEGAGGSRIWVTPTARLLADPDLAMHLGRPSPTLVPSVPGLSTFFKPLPEDPSPANRLDARHRVVPFDWEVRKAERKALEQWCASDDEIGLRLFVGSGGSGKSRLLGEWCAEQRARGWRAGFVEDEVEPSQVGAMLRSVAPTLLVVDYAERRSNIRPLLQAAACGGETPRLRIALLARSAGDWWALLREQGNADLSVPPRPLPGRGRWTGSAAPRPAR